MSESVSSDTSNDIEDNARKLSSKTTLPALSLSSSSSSKSDDTLKPSRKIARIGSPDETEEAILSSLTSEITDFDPSLIDVADIFLAISSTATSETEDVTLSSSSAALQPMYSETSEATSRCTTPIIQTDYSELSLSSGTSSAALSSPCKLKMTPSEEISQELSLPSTSGLSKKSSRALSLSGTSMESLQIECAEPELASVSTDVILLSPKERSAAGGPFLSQLLSFVSRSTKSQPLKQDTKKYTWVFIDKCKIKGLHQKSSLNNVSYCSFYGIPYAQPPVGKLRFKPPQPTTKLLCESYDATYERDMCIQERYFNSEVLIGSENCLYLNINTPVEPEKITDLLPVMVYIHGGGYFFGSGNSSWHSVEYLIQYDVIIVTFNYRLHILGFLNLEQSFCPGNLGLKDQVMALQWIKKNIKNFGGNPDNVTIFGSSAGAACVNLHMVSPLSRGLFHKAIMQSGNMYCPWGLARNSLQFTTKIVKKMGGPINCPKAMFEFLENQPIENLVRQAVQGNYNLRNSDPFDIFYESFGPVVECYKENAFLPSDMQELKQHAYVVPTIVGLNNYEGLLQFTVDNVPVQKITQNIDQILGATFHVPYEKCTKHAKLLQKFYFKKKLLNRQIREQLVNFYTDLYFYRFYDAIDFLVESSVSVFIYEFAYRGNRNLFMNTQVKKMYRLNGAGHSDEISYLFAQKNKYTPRQLSKKDLKTIKRMCTLWTNFAKSNCPTQNTKLIWQRFFDSRPCYLHISKKLEMKYKRMNGDRIQLMREVIDYITMDS